MGKSARLAFLCLEFGPDVHERGVELVVEEEGAFLRHVGREDKGEDPFGYGSFDGVNPYDLASYDQMQSFSNVACGFLL